MYKLFALLICFFMTHLNAEVFEDFEYHLPNQGQGWKRDVSLNNCPSEMLEVSFPPECNIIQYVPESLVIDGPNEHVEIFTIISNNNVDIKLSDTDALINDIKLGAKVIHPNAILTVNILEETPDSVIFETVANNEDQVVMKSLNRYISHGQKVICCSYITNDIPQYEQESLLWLETLKGMKLIEQ